MSEKEQEIRLSEKEFFAISALAEVEGRSIDEMVRVLMEQALTAHFRVRQRLGRVIPFPTPTAKRDNP